MWARASSWCADGVLWVAKGGHVQVISQGEVLDQVHHCVAVRVLHRLRLGRRQALVGYSTAFRPGGSQASIG